MYRVKEYYITISKRFSYDSSIYSLKDDLNLPFFRVQNALDVNS